MTIHGETVGRDTHQEMKNNVRNEMVGGLPFCSIVICVRFYRIRYRISAKGIREGRARVRGGIKGGIPSRKY